jgi:hypothetical protein
VFCNQQNTKNNPDKQHREIKCSITVFYGKEFFHAGLLFVAKVKLIKVYPQLKHSLFIAFTTYLPLGGFAFI